MTRSTSLFTTLIAGLCLAGTSAAFLPPTPAQAAPATAATPDFDGDGKADVAAGVYLDSNTDTWGVRVWYGSGTVRDITAAELGGSGWDLNGPLLARDLDADGYTDLVLPSRRGDAGAQVSVVKGSASGLDLATATAVALPSSTGYNVASLALVESPKPRLAVGIQKIYTTKLYVYDLGAAGLPTGSPTTLKPGSGKVPSLSTNSLFGEALASSGDRLFVGAPLAKVGGKKYAGAIVAVRFATSGVSSARRVTQSTTGVAGAPGTSDRFGTSLAARDDYLVVGADGDDVGRIANTGSVQVFSIAGGALKPLTRLSQSTTGVPGKTEKGDRFGVSVAIGSVCAGVPSVVVGGLGEKITAGHENDGSAWIIPLVKSAGCTAAQLYEGHGLTGTPTSGVGLGAMVAVVRDAGKSVDDVLIAGHGDYSEGPNGRLVRWSPTAGETFRFDSLLVAVAGR